MSEPIWVCSRWNTAPKDEEKFQVINKGNSWYTVRISGEVFCLPKAHYSPCPAPEQWEPVEVKFVEHGSSGERLRHFHDANDGEHLGSVEFRRSGYRVTRLTVARREGEQ